MRNFKKSIIASALTASLALVGVANATTLTVTAAVNASCGTLSLDAGELAIGDLTPGADKASIINNVKGTCVNGSSANIALSNYYPNLSISNGTDTIPFVISSTTNRTGAWTGVQVFNATGAEERLSFYAIALPGATARVGAYAATVDFTATT